MGEGGGLWESKERVRTQKKHVYKCSMQDKNLQPCLLQAKLQIFSIAN